MKVLLAAKSHDEEEASISVFDHGLLYGDGVFEGIRIIINEYFSLMNILIDYLILQRQLLLKYQVSKR